MDEEKLPNKIRFNKHPRRKTNDLAAAIYAMYKTGKSLTEIAKVYRKTRQAIYGVLRTLKYPLRSKKMEGMRTICGIRYTYDGEGYLRGTTDKKRVYAHKILWEKINGKIPSDSVIHFIDGNKENIVIENLALIKKTEMALTFNPMGKNQFSVRLAEK